MLASSLRPHAAVVLSSLNCWWVIVVFVSVFFFSKSSAPQLKKFYRFSFESTAQPEYLLRNEKKPPVDGTAHTHHSTGWIFLSMGCEHERLPIFSMAKKCTPMVKKRMTNFLSDSRGRPKIYDWEWSAQTVVWSWFSILCSLVLVLVSRSPLMRWGLKGNPKVEWLVVESWQGGKVTTTEVGTREREIPTRKRHAVLTNSTRWKWLQAALQAV